MKLWPMLDILMCSIGQWRDKLRCSGVQGWICSCVVLVNGGICSCAVLVNSGYIHLQELSIVYMLRCSGGQWLIYSCVRVINCQYAHVQ